MNCKSALIGVIFGLVMANKPETSLLHAFIAFSVLFSMMYIEDWASKKVVGKKEIHGVIRSLVFLVMALFSATLYVKIESMDFFLVAFAGALFAIGTFYFPTLYLYGPKKQNVDAK